MTNYLLIDPAKAFESAGAEGISEDLPGTVSTDLAGVASPNGIYVIPYTGYIYATDAASYGGAGELLQWDADGKFLGKHKVYINPSRMIALPPDGIFGAVDNIAVDRSDDTRIFNLQGMQVENTVKGQIYISAGRKFIAQ